MKTLSELHEKKGFVRTAHRGASFDDAENTLAAFERAVKYSTDFIEFDLRMTKDGVPVLLHDKTIDKTANGTGRPEDHTLAELKKLNFSYYYQWERHETPLYPHLEIPTFEEVLQNFRDKACMNIQVYADPAGIETICKLYLKYDMRDRGYLTIANPQVIAQVRSISKEIDICYTPGWKERALPANLEECARIGCRFVQPVAEAVTKETFDLCRKLGLRANVYYYDDPEKVREAAALGMNGFLTNRIHLFAE